MNMHSEEWQTCNYCLVRVGLWVHVSPCAVFKCECEHMLHASRPSPLQLINHCLAVASIWGQWLSPWKLNVSMVSWRLSSIPVCIVYQCVCVHSCMSFISSGICIWITVKLVLDVDDAVIVCWSYKKQIRGFWIAPLLLWCHTYIVHALVNNLAPFYVGQTKVDACWTTALNIMSVGFKHKNIRGFPYICIFFSY